MTENTVSEIERMVVTRVFDAHASWFGRRGQTRSTSCSGGDRRALLRPLVRWTFALEENFSAA